MFFSLIAILLGLSIEFFKTILIGIFIPNLAFFSTSSEEKKGSLMPVDFYRIMKIIFCCPAFLLILSCCDRPEAAFDPRSVQYNDRAVEMMQSFIREETFDTTGFSDAATLADSSRIMFGSIVDSCQALLDSAVMYSPDYYLYYAQKAFFYAYCADYERSYRWISEALARKDIPEIRLYAGMLLHKMGKH